MCFNLGVLVTPVAFIVVGPFALMLVLVAGLVVAGGLVLVGFTVVVLTVESFPVPCTFVVLLVMSSRSDIGGESSLCMMDGGMNCRATLRSPLISVFKSS